MKPIHLNQQLLGAIGHWAKGHAIELDSDQLGGVFHSLLCSAGAYEPQFRFHSWVYHQLCHAVSQYGWALTDRVPLQLKREDMTPVITPLLILLPQKYQEVVELAEIQGLTQFQIANKLGFPLNQVKQNLHSGRRLMLGLFTSCSQVQPQEFAF